MTTETHNAVTATDVTVGNKPDEAVVITAKSPAPDGQEHPSLPVSNGSGRTVNVRVIVSGGSPVAQDTASCCPDNGNESVAIEAAKHIIGNLIAQDIAMLANQACDDDDADDEQPNLGYCETEEPELEYLEATIVLDELCLRGEEVFKWRKKRIKKLLGFNPKKKRYAYYAHPIVTAYPETLKHLRGSNFWQAKGQKATLISDDRLAALIEDCLIVNDDFYEGQEIDYWLNPAILTAEALGVTQEDVMALDIYLATMASILVMNANVPSFGAMAEAMAADAASVPVLVVSPHEHVSHFVKLFLPNALITIDKHLFAD